MTSSPVFSSVWAGVPSLQSTGLMTEGGSVAARIEDHRPGCVPPYEVTATGGHHQVLGQVSVHGRPVPHTNDGLHHANVLVLEHHPMVLGVGDRSVQLVNAIGISHGGE